MVKKFQLLLLDANIVIELFRLGIWDAFLERCDVHLSRTIAEVEVRCFKDEAGAWQDIDLSPYITAGHITVFDVSRSQMSSLQAPFPPNYLERFDAGELEALAYLMSSEAEYSICSADSIVCKSLGFLGKGERAFSLEGILSAIGLSRRLDIQFCEPARDRWVRQGFVDGL